MYLWARRGVAALCAVTLPACALDSDKGPSVRTATSAAAPAVQQVSFESSIPTHSPQKDVKLPRTPAVAEPATPLPIDLPSALQLSNARPVDVAAAAERVQVALAQWKLARVLWIPSITLGADYHHHEGKIQEADGRIIDISRGGAMFGVGSGLLNASIIPINDAIFAPLAARQTLRQFEADQQAAINDSLVAATDAYFSVQQSRGELAAATAVRDRCEELVRRTRGLVPALTPDFEAARVEAELARRQQAVELADERWKITGAELQRVLRLDPTTQVEPVEPPELRIDLIDPNQSVDDLIPIALTNRPELASRQAQVQATLTLLKQERLRPLIPSLLIRGWSTPVTGTLAAGVFTNIDGETGFRSDLDFQLLWQFENLGFGNVARTQQRRAENRLAIVELFRVQDRVAAEVAQALARVNHASRRVKFAGEGVKQAVDSADKNLIALGQVRRVGETNQLVVRPQEALASVQALAQAYADYYGAIADFNRAQFQLYRALGYSSQCLSNVTGTNTSPREIVESSVIPSVQPQPVD